MDANLDRIALPAGTLLFVEGEPGSCAYLVTVGRIEIFLTRDDREVLLAQRGAGEIVGEIAILDSRPRSASARVVEDCELVVIAADQMAHRMADADPILRMCLGVVIARYREMVGMVDSGDRRQFPSAPPPVAGDIEAAIGTLSIEGDLRRALRRGELELHFQPIVATGCEAPQLPAACELLVRLREDDGQLVMPEEFIPAAERYNLVSSIDRWVVRRAAETLQQHASGDEPPFLFALNLSGTSLSDRSFLDYVLSLIEQPRVARGLCFEITETAVITSMTQAISFMRELRKRGCRFALDDFGSGLSSFHYLKTLPVDFLKIDGQFIGSVTTDVVDRSMVEAISRVGRALGIATIAEKVESAEVFAELRRLGVQFAQGYFVARPAPIETLTAATARGLHGAAAGILTAANDGLDLPPA